MLWAADWCSPSTIRSGRCAWSPWAGIWTVDLQSVMWLLVSTQQSCDGEKKNAALRFFLNIYMNTTPMKPCLFWGFEKTNFSWGNVPKYFVLAGCFQIGWAQGKKQALLGAMFTTYFQWGITFQNDQLKNWAGLPQTLSCRRFVANCLKVLGSNPDLSTVLLLWNGHFKA